MAITVKKIQLALLARGYDLGSYGADGVAGAATMKALQKFQLDNFLPDSGKADEYTLRRLFPEAFPLPQQKETIMKHILGGLFSGLFQNLLNWQLVQGYIRQALLVLGGAAVGSGWIDGEQLNTAVGAVMVIVGIVFANLSNNTKAKAYEVIKAAEASPTVVVIPAAESPTSKPMVMAKSK
jgi:peptidoglycan hydrolase-like protein with peptidoglycan-binding domain